MKLAKNLKVFAIAGRGYLEIRAAKIPPKAKIDEYVSTITYNQRRLVRRGPMDYEFVDEPKTEERTIRTFTWKGGRVLGTIPPVYGCFVPINTCKELTPAQVTKVLKRLEEKIP